MKDLFRRILNLLLPAERREAVRVSVTVFFNALLDFISLASLLPILYYLLEDSSNRKASLIFCLVAISVCLLKYIVATRSVKYQNVFLLGLYKRLSYSLYSSYFRRGLLFIRKKGVNQLNYEINGICYAFSQSILAPLIKMAGDSLLIVLVLLDLVIYSPLTALVLFASFIPFVLVYALVVRKKAKEYGRKEMEAKRGQSRVVNDSFGGYAELQVNDAFQVYSRQFLDGMDTIAANRLKMNMVQRLPLFLSELAVVAGLAVLCLFHVGDVSVLIGIFAVAAFRLLPAMRSIMAGWTTIKNAENAHQIIEEGMVTEGDDGDEEIIFMKEIEFRNLSYSYPDGGEVLRNFNLTVSKGEYVGFRGDSGAGKSTLFNLLLGFIPATEDGIFIDGRELGVNNRKSWLGKVGYVAQDVFIFNSSLADNIAMGAEIDRERMNMILDSLNMKEWLSEQADGLDTLLSERGGNLSGGQRQRLGIARAIYRNVSVLLLDEASSSLDNETEREMLAILDSLRSENPGLTILSIAHRDSSLVNCDRIIKI